MRRWATRFAAKQWIQFDNAYDVGMTGLLGYGGCYEACHESDLLVMLGTDFPYDNFLPQANTIQIDRDPTRLGRRTSLKLGIEGRRGRHPPGGVAPR